MGIAKLKTGDLVIYSMPKRSRQPGPRARSVYPAQAGDDYSYVVEKFWIVLEVFEDHVRLATRRGKVRDVRSNDPLLRKANLWERWWNRSRFPDATVVEQCLTAPCDRNDHQLSGTAAQ